MTLQEWLNPRSLLTRVLERLSSAERECDRNQGRRDKALVEELVGGEENVVRDLVVEHQGRSHRATYFVEHGQIYVKTGAKLFRLPVTATPPADAVRVLLIGLATDAAREAGQSARWAEILTGGSAAAK